MKTTKSCPKCQSTEIYTNEGHSKQGDRARFQISSFSTALISSYICTSCGFIEEYLENDDLNDQKKMLKLKEKWRKHS